MEPLVTIAIPVYNAETTIKYAINSVIMQKYHNWELLIINDGSTDNSMQIIRQFTDKRITFIDDGENLGLIDRLNSIPLIATGKYIARMDADDMMHPDRLFHQVLFMESHSDVDVIDSAVYIIDQDNKPYGIRNLEELPTDQVSLLHRCLFTHPAVLGKSEWFKSHRYDRNFYRAEDYELWLRSFNDTKFGRIRIPLLFYREGRVNVRNYINSMNSVRKIYMVYGSNLISNTARNLSVLKSYGKQFIYIFFAVFKAQMFLTYFRNSKLDESQLHDSNKIILRIKSFRV